MSEGGGGALRYCCRGKAPTQRICFCCIKSREAQCLFVRRGCSSALVHRSMAHLTQTGGRTHALYAHGSVFAACPAFLQVLQAAVGAAHAPGPLTVLRDTDAQGRPHRLDTYGLKEGQRLLLKIGVRLGTGGRLSWGQREKVCARDRVGIGKSEPGLLMTRVHLLGEGARGSTGDGEVRCVLEGQ